MVSVLFVCLGNICRSPMAESIAKHIVESTEEHAKRIKRIESAATSNWEIGNSADARTLQVLKENGIKNLMKHRARQLNSKDFHEFEYILCMDKSNYSDILSVMPKVCKAKDKHSPKEISDPYYGDLEHFRKTFFDIKISLELFLNEIPQLI